MSDKKAIKTDEVVEVEDTQPNSTSRRKLIKGAALGAPLLMTLAHRPAFGAICTISGFQSVNPSGPPVTPGPGCGGYSPGGWKQPDVGQGNSDGSRQQWIAAGYYPNPRDGYIDPITQEADPAATTFRTAFGGGSTRSMHDILLEDSGSLKFHAIANLLNAGYFSDYRLSKADVIGLFWAAKTGGSYTTTSGTVVTISKSDLQVFFEQYH